MVNDGANVEVTIRHFGTDDDGRWRDDVTWRDALRHESEVTVEGQWHREDIVIAALRVEFELLEDGGEFARVKRLDHDDDLMKFLVLPWAANLSADAVGVKDDGRI